LDTCSITSRALTSIALPAVNGMMTVVGRVGQAWDQALSAASKASRQHAMVFVIHRNGKMGLLRNFIFDLPMATALEQVMVRRSSAIRQRSNSRTHCFPAAIVRAWPSFSLKECVSGMYLERRPV